MQVKKMQVARNISNFHVVVKIDNDTISFFAYSDENQLAVTLDHQQMLQLKFFATLEELFEYIREEEDCLGIDGTQLIVTIKVGKKEKDMSIMMEAIKMDPVKQVKMNLKKQGFISQEISAKRTECQKNIAELEIKVEEKKAEQKVEKHLKQECIRSIKECAKKIKKEKTQFESMNENLKNATELYYLFKSKLEEIKGGV